MQTAELFIADNQRGKYTLAARELTPQQLGTNKNIKKNITIYITMDW